MKTFLLLFFLLGSGNSISAQNNKIDSLKKVLQTAVEDTNKVSTLQQLANELQWTGKFETALTFANQSLQIAKKLNFKRGQANAYLVLGDISTGYNNYSSAFNFLDSCITIRQQLHDQPGLAEAYIFFAEVYRMEDNYPQSISQLLKAEKIYDALNDTSALTNLYSLYGTIYIDYGHTDEAISSLLKAINAHRKNGNSRQLSNNLSTLSLAYLEHGNLSEALVSINEAIAIRSKLEINFIPLNSLNLAKVYVQIGDKLAIEGKYAGAKDTFELALKEMSLPLETFEKQNNYLGKVNSYITLGRIYLGLNNFMQANYFLQKCLALSLQTKNLFEARDSYLYLSKMYSKRNKLAEAFENFQMYIVFRDSMVNQANTKQIAQLQMQYAFEKEEAIAKATQERKDAIAMKERERQKMVRNSFVGGFAVMMLFAGVFFTQRNRIKKEKRRSDELLLNILPGEVAEELKAKGRADAKQFDEVTVMFTDFKGFTQISEKLSAAELVAEIDTFFKAFDNIISNHNIEKIKTIGDSYMCAGGLPVANKTNATDVVCAAMEIQQFVQKYIEQKIKNGKEPFEIRIGIHTGPVVAGIVGIKKFAYDIWGDSVNIASRMESSGEAGKVNISGTTYQLVKDKYNCSYRGKIQAKNKGEIDMYFVESIA